MSITAIAGLLVGPIADLIGKFVPDKDEANRLAYEVATMAATQGHEIALEQIKTNQLEAQSPSLFKGGWRPATGWTCVIALFNNFVIVPYIEGFTDIDIPVLDWNIMSPILLGMLGLTAARSYEKAKGVSSP